MTLLASNNNILQHRKRLKSAFWAIYFMVSFRKKIAVKKLGVPHVTIDMPDDTNVPAPCIDQKSLSEMVRNKSFDMLHRLGGINQIALALGKDGRAGISGNEEILKSRVTKFGINTYQKPPVKCFLSFLLEALKNVTVIILLLCATLSLSIGIKTHDLGEGWYEGGSNMFVVILFVVDSAIRNYKQSRKFKLIIGESSNNEATVVRDGNKHQIPITEVVVGDIVCLKKGDQIPADGLFFDTDGDHRLKVDISTVTEESHSVEININKNPFLLFGTKVTDGYGHMLVTSVGMNTAMMSSPYNLEKHISLQAQFKQLTSYIGLLGLIESSLVPVILQIRYFSGKINGNDNHQMSDSVEDQADIVHEIRLFIQNRLMVNITTRVIIFIATLCSDKSPLTSTQLVWIDFLSITLGAAALVTQKPANDLMANKMGQNIHRLITNATWRSRISQALYQVMFLLILYFNGNSIFGVSKKVKNTLLFNTIALTQGLNELITRILILMLEKTTILEGLHKNKLYLGIVSGSIFLQVLMVETLERLANTERLDCEQWVACIVISTVLCSLGLLTKCIIAAI